MIAALLAAGIIFLILVGSEYLWRKKILRGEGARKTIHILTGVFIASWPFYMSFKAIQLLSLAMIVVVSLARYLKLFGSIHGIDRKTAGDILFAMGVGATALLTSNKWIFAAAIMHLGLADGLAALVGTRAKKDLFRFRGQRRTIAGSLTFFGCSLVILGWLTLLAKSGLDGIAIYAPWLAIQATAVEAVGIYGTDNILVPVFITVILSSLR